MKGIIAKKHKDYISKLSELEHSNHISNQEYTIKKDELSKEFYEHLCMMDARKVFFININYIIRKNNKKLDKLYSILDKRFKILTWFIYFSVFLFISYSYFKPFFDKVFFYLKVIIEFNRYTLDISYFLFSISIIMIYIVIIFIIFKILEKLIPFMDSLFFLYFFKSVKRLSFYVYGFNRYEHMTIYFKIMKFILGKLYIIRISYFFMLFLLVLLVKK